MNEICFFFGFYSELKWKKKNRENRSVNRKLFFLVESFLAEKHERKKQNKYQSIEEKKNVKVEKFRPSFSSSLIPFRLQTQRIAYFLFFFPSSIFFFFFRTVLCRPSTRQEAGIWWEFSFSTQKKIFSSYAHVQCEPSSIV